LALIQKTLFPQAFVTSLSLLKQLAIMPESEFYFYSKIFETTLSPIETKTAFVTKLQNSLFSYQISKLLADRNRGFIFWNIP